MYGYYGIPPEYLAAMQAGQTIAASPERLKDFELIACHCPQEVIVMESAHPGSLQTIDFIKRTNVVHISENSVEEGLFYCERQMSRDAFYMGGNAVTEYKVEMKIWEGKADYRATGNIVSLGRKKK